MMIFPNAIINEFYFQFIGRRDFQESRKRMSSEITLLKEENNNLKDIVRKVEKENELNRSEIEALSKNLENLKGARILIKFRNISEFLEFR